MSNLVPLEEGLKQIAAKVWYWPVIRGTLAVLLGLAALIWPGITVVVLVVLIGAFALLDGVVGIVEAVRYRAAGGMAVRLVLGALGVAFGLILLIAPVKSALALVWVIGLWAVLVGILQSVTAISLRAVPGSGWGWSLAGGLASLLFGVLVLVNVAAGALAILWLIALYAIVLGILLIAVGLQIRSTGRKI